MSDELVSAVRQALSTERERELFAETEFTKPVDFHSWRRAFGQALADAELNAQAAVALAGHSSLAAHQRYLSNTSQANATPAAALHAIGVHSAFTQMSRGVFPFSGRTSEARSRRLCAR
jgi:hypothetical protein